MTRKSTAYFWVVLFLVSSVSVFGQQASIYTQHMFHKYQFNPAYAGLERSLSVTLANRSQWSKLTQNPTNQILSAHMPFYLINGGIGLVVENERIGLENNTSLEVSYNYIYKNSLGIFSAGLGIGVVRKQLDGSGIITPEGVYQPVINHNDPLLPTQLVGGNGTDWRLGLYYVGNYFEGGFTIENLPAHNVNITDFNIDLSTHYNFYVETDIILQNQDIIIHPSLFIIANNQEVQVTTSCVAEFGNILAGVGLRGFNSKSLEGLNFIMGMRLNKHMKLHYSYDYGLNSLQTVSDGTHELMINYNLEKLIEWGLPPKVRYNPRHL